MTHLSPFLRDGSAHACNDNGVVRIAAQGRAERCASAAVQLSGRISVRYVSDQSDVRRHIRSLLEKLAQHLARKRGSVESAKVERKK
jgi:hypothetical protein